MASGVASVTTVSANVFGRACAGSDERSDKHVRWSHFFGQVANVYSGVERRHWNDKEERRFSGGE